ncbi:MAG: TolC family protein [Planctomycetes bacterium]|nr:TolC family protein [Planctomycetota bacterium]
MPIKPIELSKDCRKRQADAMQNLMRPQPIISRKAIPTIDHLRRACSGVLALAFGAGLLMIFGLPPSAMGQAAALADEIVILSRGVNQQERARGETHLGGTLGGRASPYAYDPGGREPVLMAHPVPGAGAESAAPRDVLSAASGNAPGNANQVAFQTPATEVVPRPEIPLYGPLDLPVTADEGPVDGMTLESAIEMLVRGNLDLRTKFLEIPQARADVLTAGLRANPLLFGTASGVPYGSYSPARPGENGYSVTVIQAVDVNRKRLARVDAACHALQVLEAQYEDAVRLEIDALATAFVDVLAARETVRYAESAVGGLNKLTKLAETQLRQGRISEPDYERLAIQRDSAEIGLEQAQAQLYSTLRSLTRTLNMPSEAADTLQLRGTLLPESVEPPTREDLIPLALSGRPDLTAYRLGVRRAQSDHRLAQAERFPDVFVLYSPFEATNNRPTGGQNAESWSVGAMASVPLFNRNQGNIRRAEVNVAQSENELAAIESLIVRDVDQAFAEYQAARRAVEQLQTTTLPRAKRMRDGAQRLVTQGELGVVEYLNAQRDYNEIIRQYRDSAVRYRRSMLHLNTVVSERLFP